MLTDDPETPGNGKREISVAGTFEHSCGDNKRGARQQLSEQVTLLLSIGYAVRALHDEARHLIAYSALQFTF